MDFAEVLSIRDRSIGLQAELDESNYQRGKTELLNAQLRYDIQDLNDRLRIAENALRASQQLAVKVLHDISIRDAEIVAIRKSRTWRIGSSVLAPVRWVRRSKS